jgi:hypothetical protein
MKNLLLFSLLTLLFILTSCNDNENCITLDIAGVYEGTKECDEMNLETIMFDVIEGNNDIQLIIDGVTTIIDECDIFGSTITNGTGREIDGDIDGTKVSFIETIKVNDEVEIRCFWEGFKK